jgi:hypothetical protein
VGQLQLLTRKERLRRHRKKPHRNHAALRTKDAAILVVIIKLKLINCAKQLFNEHIFLVITSKRKLVD